MKQIWIKIHEVILMIIKMINLEYLIPFIF
jgi:hypothetical protein